MMAASVLLVSTIVGVDMQQDRSTGWRLGSKRAIQFRYQAAGIAMGAVLCVVLAKLFMSAYPVLTHRHLRPPRSEGRHLAVGDDLQVRGRDPRHRPPRRPTRSRRWRSAWRSAWSSRWRGAALAASARYQRLIESGSRGFAIGWIVDAILLSQPVRVVDGRLPRPRGAASGSQAAASSARCSPGKRAARKQQPEVPPEGGRRLPADMSTTSLVGGGLIAGESLYALGAGIASLLGTMLLRK